MKTLTLVFLFALLGHHVAAQVTYSQLLTNRNFHWVVDSSFQELTIYYQAGSWIDKNLDNARLMVVHHFNSTKSFIGIQSYGKRIHLFVVDSRAEMKLLVGWETNGSAFYKYDVVTGIASENINSVNSNHELFHLIAMNVWGIPSIWLNEGMAVYSDNAWQGYDLYQLTKYLVDHNKYVPLEKLIKDFWKVDNTLSYPLLGSFVKYLDETYGRDVVLKIWKTKPRKLKKVTGKTIEELEADWLAKIMTVKYKEITY